MMSVLSAVERHDPLRPNRRPGKGSDALGSMPERKVRTEEDLHPHLLHSSGCFGKLT